MLVMGLDTQELAKVRVRFCAPSGVEIRQWEWEELMERGAGKVLLAKTVHRYGTESKRLGLPYEGYLIETRYTGINREPGGGTVSWKQVRPYETVVTGYRTDEVVAIWLWRQWQMQMGHNRVVKAYRTKMRTGEWLWPWT